jgi:large subunit ribosomal protein L25
LSTTPRNIPDEIVIDITDMTMDSIIRLSDIPLPTGVTAVGDPDTPIVTVLALRTAGGADEGGASEEAEGAAPAEAASDEAASDEAASDDSAE